MDLQKALARIEELEEQLELQRMLADNAFEAIGVFDDSLRCVAGNKEVATVLGYSPEEVLGIHLLDCLDKKYHAIVAKNVHNNVTEPYMVYGKRKDGTTFPAEGRGRTVFFKNKRYRVASLHDITFRKTTHADLQIALHEMEIIFANTKVGLMFLKGGRYVRRVNQTMAEMFGYDSPDDMRGLDVRELHLSEKNYHEFGDIHFSSLAEGAQIHIEYRLRRKDNTAIWCSLSGQAVDTENPIDLNKGVLWVIDDISKQKAEEARLIQLATTDDLTGALSRSEFFRLGEDIMENENRKMAGNALLMIDLDHFKKVNDTYGHDAGDAVLQTFAHDCRRILRDKDLFTRLGGEEFAILLPDSDLGGAIIVAERLRRRIAASKVRTDKGDIFYTVSIGVAGTGSHTISMEELLRRADKSLYEAKHEGRNRVIFYD
nr:sensor domain-containing diguanylate cyclase [uncultured Pseudodesulfovibrio sp.]